MNFLHIWTMAEHNMAYWIFCFEKFFNVWEHEYFSLLRGETRLTFSNYVDKISKQHSDTHNRMLFENNMHFIECRANRFMTHNTNGGYNIRYIRFYAELSDNDAVEYKMFKNNDPDIILDPKSLESGTIMFSDHPNDSFRTM